MGVVQGDILAIRVTNFDPVAASYGFSRASAMMTSLRHRAEAMLGSRVRQLSNNCDRLTLFIAPGTLDFGSDMLAPRGEGRQHILELLFRLSETGETCADPVPQLNLRHMGYSALRSLDDTLLSDHKILTELNSLYDGMSFDMADGMHGYRRMVDPEARYRADMIQAQQFLQALTEGHINFAWQAICDRNEHQKVFFYQLTPQYEAGASNASRIPLPAFGSAIATLDRLGLARLFDLYAAHYCLSQLRIHQDLRLGLAISSSSAEESPWWTSFFAELAHQPSVADRLTVSMVSKEGRLGTPPVASFARRLRRMGANVIIEDFGRSATTLQDLKLLGATAVKIDACQLVEMHRSHGMEALDRINHLLRLYVRETIITNVDSEELAHCARQIDADWVQGLAVAPPSKEFESIHVAASENHKVLAGGYLNIGQTRGTL